ncbi:hypothetical protein [Ammoniphilus sp. 3BR4]|uniref:hypothetical protein n=1 Tax=Ammoniphilus sp. 3BR4 TaxID=3158265 RepID=UPI003466F87C
MNFTASSQAHRLIILLAVYALVYMLSISFNYQGTFLDLIIPEKYYFAVSSFFYTFEMLLYFALFYQLIGWIQEIVKEIQALDSSIPLTPWKTIAYLFIPVFNVYGLWRVFQWLSESFNENEKMYLRYLMPFIYLFHVCYDLIFILDLEQTSFYLEYLYWYEDASFVIMALIWIMFVVLVTQSVYQRFQPVSNEMNSTSN